MLPGPEAVVSHNMTTESSAGMAWISRIQPVGPVGLSSILLRKQDGLTADGVRIEASWADVYTARLVEHSVATSRSVLIVPPDPLHALCALVPAAAHVARMAATRTRSDLRIAVVTADPRVRSVYRKLGIGSARLADVVPAATIGTTGTVDVLGCGNGSGGMTIYLANCRQIRDLGRVDLVVIDLPAPEAEYLDLSGPPAVIIARDPADRDAVRFARDLPCLAWDRDDLSGLGEIVATPGLAWRAAVSRLDRVAAGVSVSVVPVEAQSVADNASLFWADAGLLLRAASHSSFARRLAHEAFSLYHDLMHAVVPVGYYESVAGPLVTRRRAIEQAARLAQGDVGDLYLPMAGVELSDLISAIGRRPPKTDALEVLLRDLLDRGSTALVAHNTLAARAIEEWLAEQPGLRGRVSVVPIGALAAMPPVRSAVLTGMAPAWARYIYHCGIAEHVLVLAYAGDDGQGGVAGDAEAELVQRTIRFQAAYRSWMARPAAKAECCRRICGLSVHVEDPAPDPPSVLSTTEDGRTGRRSVEPDVPPGLLEDLADLRLLEGSLRNAPGRETTTGGPGAVDLVPAIKVRFTDGRWVLVKAQDGVTVVRQSGPVSGHPVDHLRAGDVMVLIDGDARKDLLAKVLEVGAEIPELAVAAGWLEPWSRSLAAARRSFETYEAFARALRAVGCRLETQTIRLWVVGTTIGPRDPEDIRRVGLVTNDDVLIRNHLRVSGAMEMFRGAHTRLGLRIARLARSIGPRAATTTPEEDEVIDERSGLSASDFRGCVDLLEVAGTETAGDVPLFLIGHVEAA